VIADALEKGVRERSLAVRIERTVCLGKCNDGPNLWFVGGRFRQNLSMDDVLTLLDEFEERAGKKTLGQCFMRALRPAIASKRTQRHGFYVYP